jgi:hypothetical protein
MVVNNKIIQNLYSNLLLDSSEKSIEFVNNLFYGTNCSGGKNELFLNDHDYDLLIDLVEYYKNGGCIHCDISTVFEII